MLKFYSLKKMSSKNGIVKIERYNSFIMNTNYILFILKKLHKAFARKEHNIYYQINGLHLKFEFLQNFDKVRFMSIPSLCGVIYKL